MADDKTRSPPVPMSCITFRLGFIALKMAAGEIGINFVSDRRANSISLYIKHDSFRFEMLRIVTEVRPERRSKVA